MCFTLSTFVFILLSVSIALHIALKVELSLDTRVALIALWREVHRTLILNIHLVDNRNRLPPILTLSMQHRKLSSVVFA